MTYTALVENSLILENVQREKSDFKAGFGRTTTLKVEKYDHKHVFDIEI
jgi:hypothetical protein